MVLDVGCEANDRFDARCARRARNDRLAVHDPARNIRRHRHVSAALNAPNPIPVHTHTPPERGPPSLGATGSQRPAFSTATEAQGQGCEAPSAARLALDAECRRARPGPRSYRKGASGASSIESLLFQNSSRASDSERLSALPHPHLENEVATSPRASVAHPHHSAGWRWQAQVHGRAGNQPPHIEHDSSTRCGLG